MIDFYHAREVSRLMDEHREKPGTVPDFSLHERYASCNECLLSEAS